MKRAKDVPIDFVVLWVDGNDSKWLKEKNRYLNSNGDSNVNRFRDCENLQYLFRGIEKYASWVHKIFFVTWGHVPTWLDTKNPKIRVVKHEEFIPKEYLPTFNSNVIELNLHRIPDLSEQFVLFNDDLFILKTLRKEDFFKNGLPADTYVEYTQLASFYNDTYYFMKANILAIINKHFKKPEVVKKNRFKMLHPKYGNFNFKTLHCLRFKKKFCGFWNFHTAQAYLKQTFEKVWSIEGEALDYACHNRFRTSTDLGHYLCRYWQLMEGNFVPKKDQTKYFIYLDDNQEALDAILKQKYQVICINDAYTHIDFDKAKREINQALDTIFPKKSQFEKNKEDGHEKRKRKN